jgi:ribosomal protein S27E
MTDEEATPAACAGGRAHDPADPVWCATCAQAIADHLAALNRLVVDLEREVDVQRGALGGGDPVSGSRTAPSPSAVVDDIDEITRLLEYWEDAHREHAGHPFRPARAYGRRVPAAVAYLRGQLGELLAGPFAHEFGRDINRAHARAQRRTAQDSVRTRKPIPCPSCDLLALAHDAGAKYIACEGCGRLLSFDEYDSWARLAAAGARATARSET